MPPRIPNEVIAGALNVTQSSITVPAVNSTVAGVKFSPQVALVNGQFCFIQDGGGNCATFLLSAVSGHTATLTTKVAGVGSTIAVGAVVIFTAATFTGDISELSATPGLITVTQVQGQPFAAGAVTKGQFVVGTAAGTYGPVTLAADLVNSTATAGSVTVVSLTGAASITTLKSALTPDGDNTRAIGTSTKRVSTIAGVNLNCFHAAADAQPSANLTDGALNFGVGGSTAVDVGWQRNGAGAISLTDGAGTSAMKVSSTAFTWDATNSGTKAIFQSTRAASGSTANGDSLFINAQIGQSGTGTNISGSPGGALRLSSGNGGASTGTRANSDGGTVSIVSGAAGTGGSGGIGTVGEIDFQVGNDLIKSLTSKGPVTSVDQFSVATTGTSTLAATDYVFGYIQIQTVSLAGNITIVFPSNVGSEWFLDTTLVTFTGFTITVKCGSGTSQKTISATSTGVWRVGCPATNVCILGQGSSSTPTYGEMYISGNATATTLTTAGTPVIVTAGWTTGASANSTQSTGSGTITINATITVQMVCTLNLTSVGVTDLLTFQLYRNGSAVAGRLAKADGTKNVGAYNLTVTGLVQAVFGDVLDIRATCTNNSATSVVVTDADFNVFGAGAL